MADVATLFERYAIEILEIRVQGEQPVLAEVGSFGNAKFQSMETVGRRTGGTSRQVLACNDGAATQRVQPRIVPARNRQTRTGPARDDRQICAPAELHLGTKPVEEKPFQKCVGMFGMAIEQKPVFRPEHEKVEENFSLGREQGGVHSGTFAQLVHIVCDESLQKSGGLGAGEGQDRTILEMSAVIHVG